MTVAALANYLDGHATTIRSLSDAERACELAKQYLDSVNPMAPVSFWTPSRQLEFCQFLRNTFGHTPASIERRLDVICAAFNEMTEIKIRQDPFGQDIETALMTHAPKFVYKRGRIAKELKIPPSKPRHNKLSIEDMAAALDRIEHEHLFRFALIALNTWARPEAVSEFDPKTQRELGMIYVNPPDRAQTNKRRPTITETRGLAGWLDKWGDGPLMVYQGERVADPKKGFRKAGLTPGCFRHFMTTMVKRYCRGVTREQRSLWLGHAVKEGSRTTDSYEAFDPEFLADVALATDFVMQQVQAKCSRKLFAIEMRLNQNDLARIGARTAENVPHLQLVNW